MNDALAYLTAGLSSWAAMGLFCIRTEAIRRRYRWHTLSRLQNRLIGFSGIGLSMLALASLWHVSIPSFAIILWVVQLGVSGAIAGFLLPYAPRSLSYSFKLALLSAVISGSGLFILY